MLGESDNLIANFEYDKNGNRNKLKYLLDGNPSGDTVAIDYTYNLDNMLTSFATTGGPTFNFTASGAGNIDGLGRLTAAYENITNTSQDQIHHDLYYQYDMRSQLLFAEMTYVLDYEWVMDFYSYDKAGNVKHHWYETYGNPPTDTAYTYLNNSDLMNTASGGGNFALTWNANGNLAKKDDINDTNLFYNWENKLCSGQRGESSIALKYDPMGNRIIKNSSITGQRKYVIDVSGALPTILLELDPNNGMAIRKMYIYANAEVLAQHDGDVNAARYFYLHDRLGSVREVIDQNSSVVRFYTYDPFGKTREFGGTLTNPFMFTGQFYDSEIAQYYLRARQYDPQLMRFTGRDPVKGWSTLSMTLHAYLYCQNDPINYTDPTGLFMSGTDIFNDLLRRPYLEYEGRQYEELTQWGLMLGLDALASMVELTAFWADRVGSSGQFIEDLLWLFTDRGPGMGRVEGNLDLRFGQRGFRREYQDLDPRGQNQVRHFVGYLATGYYYGIAGYGVARWREAGNEADILLGYRGVDLGRLIMGYWVGDFDPYSAQGYWYKMPLSDAGDWIRWNLGE
jgi:RHS repeat-associated protein